VHGAYHSIYPKHLTRYLAEFCYRFNRRFNRRFDISELLPRFMYVALRAPPVRCRPSQNSGDLWVIREYLDFFQGFLPFNDRSCHNAIITFCSNQQLGRLIYRLRIVSLNASTKFGSNCTPLSPLIKVTALNKDFL
jgi:hypothetical protein